MPGSPGYDLHQARDASLQVAKPEHTIETDAPCRFWVTGDHHGRPLLKHAERPDLGLRTLTAAGLSASQKLRSIRDVGPQSVYQKADLDFESAF
jgi:hypothetical protein